MAEAQTTGEPKQNLKFFGRKASTRQVAEKPEAPVATAEPEKEPTKPEQGTDIEAEAITQEVEVPSKVEAVPLKVILMPTAALAVRTLLILAIILADAFAAYYIVAKALAPRLIEARVVRMMREAEEPKEQPSGKSKQPSKPVVGSIMPIADVIVNPLATSGTRYLCTTIALEALDPVVTEEIKTREPQIRDMLIEILSRRTVEELSDLSVREQIREEIKTNINGLLQAGQVTGVYFSNFVLQ